MVVIGSHVAIVFHLPESFGLNMAVGLAGRLDWANAPMLKHATKAVAMNGLTVNILVVE
jgi:hypothetical protein